jgi:hypothetical protein
MRHIYLVVAIGAALTAPMAGQTALKPFLGRWDLTIDASGDQYPSWLEVAEKQGRPDARYQLRTGNVQPAIDAKLNGPRLVVTISRSEGRPDGTWDLGFEGGKLSGTQKTGDRVAKVKGVPAPALRHPAPKTWSAPTALFNGKDLSGWDPVMNTPASRQGGNNWVAKDGEITNQGKGANLRTTRVFDDFKLHIEFNIPEGENSGIYLRGRYEVQVANAPRNPRPASSPAKTVGYRNPAGNLGSVYGFLPFPLQDPKGPGEWQSFDITLIGRSVTIALNGFTGIDNQAIGGITGGALDSDEGAPGPIYFQGDHHGGIRYRNITISVPQK